MTIYRRIVAPNEMNRCDWLSFTFKTLQADYRFVALLNQPKVEAYISVSTDIKAPPKWSCDIEFVEIHKCLVDSRAAKMTTMHFDSSNLQERILVSQSAICCRGQVCFFCIVTLHNGNELVNGFISREHDEEYRQFLDSKEAARFNANCRIVLADDPGEAILVNRELLSVYSTVFKQMFQGEFAEKKAEEVTVGGVKRVDFLEFLRCLYHPVKPVSKDNVSSVLTIADQFNCEVLLRECEKYMKSNLPKSTEDFKKYIELADRIHSEELLTTIMAAAPRNIIADFLEPEWIKKLGPAAMDAIHLKAFQTFKQLDPDCE